MTWVLGGFRTELSPPPFFVERGLTWDPPDDAATSHVLGALAALGVSFGACHTEFTAAGLIEVNAATARTVRGGFLPPDLTPLLAASLTEPGEPMFAARDDDWLLVWWSAYVRLVAPPVLAAFFRHGVVLEPHLQNVLIAVDEDDWPAAVVFRDLEGVKLVTPRHEPLLAGLPAGVARGLRYDEARGWDRVAYCLLVNHLAEVAAAIADGRGDARLASARRVLDVARAWCARHGVANPEVNLGGGMAVDYQRPEAVFDWAGFGRGLAGLARPGETLRIEPGRAVTAYCGWYLTRVLDVKLSHGEAFAVVAGGTHHLRTPAAKGHNQPFAVISSADSGADIEASPVTVCGQLCTPKDILARRVGVRRLRAGDLLAFGLAGAYAWNISHHGFLMHPPPAFHYLSC
ncbi:MAG TPA: IucA/IucC family C-terminal-domain containing protein [Streptosporangiaceae bacterium]|nr:IucA/IucC family C-terminal-domain containing protein [Streptosporangiaceae bacterium]